jgi:uncharacterized protein (TIGR02246 family)
MKTRLLCVFSFVLAFAAAHPAFAQSAQAQSRQARMSRNEAQVKAVYDKWAKAFEAGNVDAIMALYAPGAEIIAYDVVPPLQYTGKDAYRQDYIEFLKQYDGPIHVEYRNLRVVAGNNVAFVHCLERFSGKLKSGQTSDFWMRTTSGLRKINGRWLIMHDHVSVPVDFATGKAVLDLKP